MSQIRPAPSMPGHYVKKAIKLTLEIQKPNTAAFTVKERTFSMRVRSALSEK